MPVLWKTFAYMSGTVHPCKNVSREDVHGFVPKTCVVLGECHGCDRSFPQHGQLVKPNVSHGIDRPGVSLSHLVRWREHYVQKC